MKYSHSTRLVMCWMLVCFFGLANADQIDIQLEVPVLDVDPYHRPFVAVWLETSSRSGVATVAVWYDDAEWLKDLRQWWRKQGRSRKNLDGFSGATRKPGIHRIHWKTPPVEAGEYRLCFEAAREAGGREVIRIPIRLGEAASKTYTVQGMYELGEVSIQVIPDIAIRTPAS